MNNTDETHGEDPLNQVSAVGGGGKGRGGEGSGDGNYPGGNMQNPLTVRSFFWSCGVYLDPYTSHIQPDTPSTSLSKVYTTSTPEILSEVIVELPSLSSNVIADKVPESNSRQNMKLAIMNSDNSNDILHEHLSKHPEIKLTNISCSDCSVTIKSIWNFQYNRRRCPIYLFI